MKSNHQLKYNSGSMALHWLMLVLLIAVYLCIELRVLYPKGSDARDTIKNWHFVLGMGVWFLLLVRIWLRVKHQAPAIQPQPSKWQRLASQTVHLILYGFLFLMPVLGWLTVGFEGKTINLLGVHLPTVLLPNGSFAEITEELHEWLGTAGYWLIGLHATASLFHHYIIKDNTLRRMLP